MSYKLPLFVPSWVKPDATIEGVVFERVYRDTVAFVYRQLRRFGVVEAELEDATQEVFVVVHRRLPEFDPERGSLRTWVSGIARGVASNALRARIRRRAREAKSLHAKPALRPDAAFERRRASDMVATFLQSLSEERRAVFELVEIEGLTAPETAAMLKVNANTVYSRLRASRVAFRQWVAEQEVAGGS